MQNLEQIRTGQDCIVIKVHGHGEFRHRILELGFVRGQKVQVIKNAPLKDPIEYQIMDSRISLRRSEARLIEVMNISEYEKLNLSSTVTTTMNVTSEELSGQQNPSRTINLALVGNPNCGKTTLFNKITGQRAKTGNYGGVTVDRKEGYVTYKGYTINIIDLPGTYSMTEYSKEEVYVREYITEHCPDIILNVVDSTNLERNLFLTTQLIDMDVRTIMSLNMYDEFEKSGSHLDHESLSTMLGFPIIPTVAAQGEGVEKILDTAIMLFEEKAEVRHFHINYGRTIEAAIKNIEKELDLYQDITAKYHSRYLAIKLLESNVKLNDIISVNIDNDKESDTKKLNKIVNIEKSSLVREYKDDPRAVITSAKYGFVRGALTETLKKKHNPRLEASAEIDGLLTNKILGIPILLGLLWLTFQATFTLGDYPMGWLEDLVGSFGEIVSGLLPSGILHDLIVDGIIAGVGSVIVFLPNILILFLFMTFMEESGYMARAAFIMDKLMHKIGLHGKSFIPLLMGFGCNVPAIIATRTLASRKDRIITMLIIPFMSCSARLPVFILMISIFFDSHRGTILLILYLIGIILAALASIVLDKTIKVKNEAPFVMELPPYRLPSARNVLGLTWDKGAQYLLKMGKTILAFSVIIWALGYFPRTTEDMSSSEALEQSYIGHIGEALEPVISPLGFDWKMGVAIVSGIGAKEVVVSTLGVLYGESDELSDDELIESSTLKENILNDTYTKGTRVGEKVYSPLIAFSFMAFILLYTPCFAVVIAIAKEGGKKWAVVNVVLSLAVAWTVSFLITTIGQLF